MSSDKSSRGYYLRTSDDETYFPGRAAEIVAYGQVGFPPGPFVQCLQAGLPIRVRIYLRCWILITDPDAVLKKIFPPDPRVFWPSGSGSSIIMQK